MTLDGVMSAPVGPRPAPRRAVACIASRRGELVAAGCAGDALGDHRARPKGRAASGGGSGSSDREGSPRRLPDARLTRRGRRSRGRAGNSRRWGMCTTGRRALYSRSNFCASRPHSAYSTWESTRKRSQSYGAPPRDPRAIRRASCRCAALLRWVADAAVTRPYRSARRRRATTSLLMSTFCPFRWFLLLSGV